MSFMAKNPLSVPEVEHTPSTPPGTRGLFAREDGWYSIDDEGKVTKIAILDDIEDIPIDAEMSDTSENPVQNKVVKGYVDDKSAEITGNLESGTLIPERSKNANYADEANYAAGTSYSSHANFADYSQRADEANHATNADYATKAGEADYAQQAYLAQEAGFTPYAMSAYNNNDGYTLIPTITNKTVDGTLNYTFEHNTVIRTNGVPTTIEFVFNDNIYPEYYSSELCFDSGETPTMLVYPEAPILNWIGTDCTVSDDNYSIFSPQANTHYDVLFYYNGTAIVGLVNGYKYASGNRA